MTKTLFFCVSLLVSAAVFAQSAPTQPVTQVIFEESELGFSPYLTRMLLSRRYLRIDEGQDDGDFVLFDRVLGNIHNINHEERSEVIIQRRPQVNTPQSVPGFRVETMPLIDAPRINGITAVQHRFYAGSELCRQSVNFDGFLDQFVEALMRYKQLLIQQSLRTLGEMPDSVKTPCYLANHIWHASDYLQAGFAVLVADHDEKRRAMVEFRQVEVPSSLLRLPANYRRFYP